jgi:hypothetical protein
VTPRLFHASEEAGIARFAPRPVPSPDSGVSGLAVWAVAESHLPNYLFPRDCPRICFRAGPATTAADAAAFLGGASRVAAFEAAWLDRVRSTALTLYEMPPATFAEALPEAGYWISREAVSPLAERRIDDLLGALAQAGAEVRVLQDFWPLRDAVVRSSLEFSIIRTANAQPRRVLPEG